jgi:hypothetical protein
MAFRVAVEVARQNLDAAIIAYVKRGICGSVVLYRIALNSNHPKIYQEFWSRSDLRTIHIPELEIRTFLPPFVLFSECIISLLLGETLSTTLSVASGLVRHSIARRVKFEASTLPVNQKTVDREVQYLLLCSGENDERCMMSLWSAMEKGSLPTC